jgi:hypothetical protein
VELVGSIVIAKECMQDRIPMLCSQQGCGSQETFGTGCTEEELDSPFVLFTLPKYHLEKEPDWLNDC